MTRGKSNEDVVPDAWSIEQEIALFKAICRYKPVGINKHFLMVCICQMVNNPNVQGPYLTTKSIWDKLATLYDLEGLDDLVGHLKPNRTIRKNGSSQSPSATSSTPPSPPPRRKRKTDIAAAAAAAAAAAKEVQIEKVTKIKSEFQLPWDDYGELLLEHARAPDSQVSSPAQLSVTEGSSSRRRGRENSLDDDLTSVDVNSENDDTKDDEAAEKSTRRRGRPLTEKAKESREQASAARGRRSKVVRGKKGGRIGRPPKSQEDEPVEEEADGDGEEADGDDGEGDVDEVDDEQEEGEQEEGEQEEASEEEVGTRASTRIRGRGRKRGGRAVTTRSSGPRRSSRQTRK
ncbi:chromatin modification-related protein EAF7-domain-containing protein [Lipomyces japonicus]|uniref:chromatin modification-related protein EAF7-domain-containing protein n=1 Tax=Lipomyces japonicus TaxID=56871 RepID=UPI0034CF6CD0